MSLLQDAFVGVPATESQAVETSSRRAAVPTTSAVDHLHEERTPTVRLAELRGDSSDAGESALRLPYPTLVPARQRFSAWSKRYMVRTAAVDAMIGVLAVVIPSAFSDTLVGFKLLVLGLIGLAAWPLAIGIARGYRRSRVGVGSEELRTVLRAGVGVVAAFAFPAGLLMEQPLLKLVVLGTPFAVVLSLGARFVMRRLLQRQQVKGQSVRTVVVVGSLAAAQQLTKRIQAEQHCGMRVMGVCLPAHEVPNAIGAGLPVLGDLTDVAAVVERFGCDGVAVTSDDATRYNYLRQLAWSLEGTGAEMLVDPGLVEVAGPRMHVRPLMGFPLLHIEEPHFTGWRKMVKRVVDVSLTGTGLLLISPILGLIALLIKLQDGGPVIFRQTRVGRGGQPFTMFKFRSMVIDAEARKAALMAQNEGKGGLFKLERDPRITRLGAFLRAFSLDELPQLFNVLQGSMSLVGPRPHLASELAQMPSEASRRSLVTPGLTGLWQVSGRSNLEGEEGVRLDLRYVENWSLSLDLLILWKTASAVLARRGAC